MTDGPTADSECDALCRVQQLFHSGENRRTKHWREIFDALDEDRSGTIDYDELADAMNTAGFDPGKRELQRIKDKPMTFPDFCRMMNRYEVQCKPD